jgi:AraC-like DNA-binding protein
MTPAHRITHNSLEPWSGDAVIKPRKFGLYFGPAGNTEPHAMHVHQFLLLLSGNMRLHIWERGRFPLRGKLQLEDESIIELSVGRPVLVPADYPIQLEGSGNLAIFFLNPEVAFGEDEAPTHHLRCELTTLSTEAVRDIVARLNSYLTDGYTKKEAAALCAEIAELLTSMGERRMLDWPVDSTLKCLFEAFDNDEDSSIKTIRERVGSRRTPPNESHIQREFGKHVGVAIRRFYIVLRLWDAVEEMAYRKNLDDVTAAADFAKGMLSRYFKRVVGICPSEFHGKGNLLILT